LLWSITVSPIRISILFEEDIIFLDLGDMIVDLLFVTDFILKFFTGYYQYGRLIKKKKVVQYDPENRKTLPEKQVRLLYRPFDIDSAELPCSERAEFILELPAVH
jgi:hypothetical protein